MAYWNPLIHQREVLPVQHVLMRKWGGGLSAGHLPNRPGVAGVLQLPVEL
jgi:hypothetical protein